MGTTLVSSFISNVNLRTDRTVEDYINFGRPLLELKIPKVIFIDREYFNLVKSLNPSNTFLVSFDRNTLEFFEEIQATDLELPEIRNVEKDTKEYMHLMSNKNFFIKKAAQINPYLHDKFLWMDFGISHILKEGEQLSDFIRLDYDFLPGKIRIGGIWPEEIAVQHDPLRQINWFFAGGVFGGFTEDLMHFYEKSKGVFIENLKIKKITWEVNLWRQVYQISPELFDIYRSDHNSSLISKI